VRTGFCPSCASVGELLTSTIRRKVPLQRLLTRRWACGVVRGWGASSRRLSPNRTGRCRTAHVSVHAAGCDTRCDLTGARPRLRPTGRHDRQQSGCSPIARRSARPDIDMLRVPALRAEAERRAEDAQARLDAAREELTRLRQQLAQESLAHEYSEAFKTKDLPTWAMKQPATEREALYELLLVRVRLLQARRFRMAEAVKVELTIDWRDWLASRVTGHSSRRTARRSPPRRRDRPPP
jgi:hypothetical protein